MCGLRTRPRADVDPPRFLNRTAIGGGISTRRPRGDTLFEALSRCVQLEPRLDIRHCELDSVLLHCASQKYLRHFSYNVSKHFRF